MQRLHKTFLILLLTGILNGCASGDKISRDIVNDVFLTDIKEDGTKLFIYIANFKGSKARQQSLNRRTFNSQQAQPRSLSNIRSDIAEKREALAIQALETKLRKNKFCRAGYFIISRYVEFGTVEIRAECQESATKTDRELYS